MDVETVPGTDSQVKDALKSLTVKPKVQKSSAKMKKGHRVAKKSLKKKKASKKAQKQARNKQKTSGTGTRKIQSEQSREPVARNLASELLAAASPQQDQVLGTVAGAKASGKVSSRRWSKVKIFGIALLMPADGLPSSSMRSFC